jgi:NAD(P)-dependent dehydrogenase (short-subunit alcohol dehydrogenase family)
MLSGNIGDNMQRIALITGANRGLGLETARQMKALGYQVILTSRDLSRGQAVARDLGLTVHTLDINRPEDVQETLAFVQAEYGRLDALVNNAAVMLDEDSSLLDVNPETLKITLETNSLAPLWLARAFLPMMLQQNYGRIVNVSSGMGQIDDLNNYSSAYRLSKLLLNGITRILADAVRGKNVLVNAVCPGWVRTDMGGPSAPRSLEQGASGIVWAATLPDEGPHGGFFRDGKSISW